MYESLCSLKVQELRLSIFVLDYERIKLWKKKKEILARELSQFPRRSKEERTLKRRVNFGDTFIKNLKSKNKLYSIGDSKMVGLRLSSNKHIIHLRAFYLTS